MRLIFPLLLASLLAAHAGCSRKARPAATPAARTTEKLPPEVEFDPVAAAKMQVPTRPDRRPRPAEAKHEN